jgi:hypothetical protein
MLSLAPMIERQPGTIVDIYQRGETQPRTRCEPDNNWNFSAMQRL